jgi:hypothetical protein
MDYPTRTRKPRQKAPDADGGDDRFELKLAEFSALFGEEQPWRIATDELELGETWRALRPERGRLH